MADMDLDRIRVLTHSCIRIESSAGTVIYFDPYDLTEAPHDADVICVTHAHYDHLSPDDIARVAKGDTCLVAPASAETEARGAGVDCVRTVAAGDTVQLADLTIAAVPAYNVEPERQNFHPKRNAWVGYVLTVDGALCYIAGDTDQNPDNSQIACDVALVPIGGTYTMDPTQAALFVNTLRPRVAIPTHYGTVVGTDDDAQTFADQVDPNIKVVIKMERRNS